MRLARLISLVARGIVGFESDIDLLYVMVVGCSLGFVLYCFEDELLDLFGWKVDFVLKRLFY